jgi:hypothetical protein
LKKLTTILAALGLLILFQGCAGKNTKHDLTALGDGTCQDRVTGQVWQINRSATPLASMEEARAYIAHLNQESKEKDWRLPTAQELYDLNYLFDLHLNGNCLINRGGKYWSEDKDGKGKVGAWEIGEQCDPSRQYAPAVNIRGYVRAIRP